MFAATAGDIERKTPCIIFSFFGQRRSGKNFSYFVEQPGVSGEVGPGCSADCLLIDLDEPADVLRAAGDSTGRRLVWPIQYIGLFG